MVELVPNDCSMGNRAEFFRISTITAVIYSRPGTYGCGIDTDSARQHPGSWNVIVDVDGARLAQRWFDVDK
jgi:hypothetical protein